jgi:hypothetical protein
VTRTEEARELVEAELARGPSLRAIGPKPFNQLCCRVQEEQIFKCTQTSKILECEGREWLDREKQGVTLLVKDKIGRLCVRSSRFIYTPLQRLGARLEQLNVLFLAPARLAGRLAVALEPHEPLLFERHALGRLVQRGAAS